MRIQLKRSNVLNSGSAKQPLAEQVEYGELCVNYNSNDPVLFLKDSADQIIRIAGSGAIGGSQATEGAAGIAEIATQAEVNAGVNDSKIVTPLKLATNYLSMGSWANIPDLSTAPA